MTCFSYPQISDRVGDPPPTAQGGVSEEELCRDDGMDWWTEKTCSVQWGCTAGCTDLTDLNSPVRPSQSLWWKSAAMYRGRKDGWCRVLLDTGGSTGRLGVCWRTNIHTWEQDHSWEEPLPLLPWRTKVIENSRRNVLYCSSLLTLQAETWRESRVAWPTHEEESVNTGTVAVEAETHLVGEVQRAAPPADRLKPCWV